MDRITLNQKAWYRGLKVIFVLTFLLTQFVGFLITNNLISRTIPYVYCDNGKSFKNDASQPNDGWYSSFFYQCDPTAYYFNGSHIKGILTDEQYGQLNKMVLQMQSQGVGLESEFQSAVDNFITQNVKLLSSFTGIILKQPGKHSFYKPEPVIDSQGFSPLFKGKDGNNWWANFGLGNKNVYSFPQKSGYFALSFFVVSIMFWLISRVFFYVFAKEKFLKFSKRNKIKNKN